MEATTVRVKDGAKGLFRLLAEKDSLVLSFFFEKLSGDTCSRFAPHPLSSEFATQLCSQLSTDTAQRFVLESEGGIVGYVILQTTMSEHEALRYAAQGITLKAGEDLLFAPCIADSYQNRGFASSIMKVLIGHYKGKAKSFVLMGGTQETNYRARSFYKKFNFKEYGGYQTDFYNIDMRLLFDC